MQSWRPYPWADERTASFYTYATRNGWKYVDYKIASVLRIVIQKNGFASAVITSTFLYEISDSSESSDLIKRKPTKLTNK